MAKTALFVRIKTLPGQRDEVVKLWEKHVKPRSESNEALEVSCYCFADEDPDTICLFEVMSEAAELQSVMEADWFKAYLEELTPLVTEASEAVVASPVWAKGIAL